MLDWPIFACILPVKSCATLSLSSVFHKKLRYLFSYIYGMKFQKSYPSKVPVPNNRILDFCYFCNFFMSESVSHWFLTVELFESPETLASSTIKTDSPVTLKCAVSPALTDTEAVIAPEPGNIFFCSSAVYRLKVMS